jgi:hypothetical protein
MSKFTVWVEAPVIDGAGLLPQGPAEVVGMGAVLLHQKRAVEEER